MPNNALVRAPRETELAPELITPLQPAAGLERGSTHMRGAEPRDPVAALALSALQALPDKAAARIGRAVEADNPAGLGRDGQLFISPSSCAPSHSRSQAEVERAAVPGILVTRPSLHKMSDGMSSTDVQVGSDAASGSASAPTTAGTGKRRRPSLRIAANTSIPFPAAATPTRARYSDHVFAGLRSAPSPPGTARFAPSFSLTLTPTPHRQHFDSFSSVVEIPRFRKRELNLGIVRGKAQGAAWAALWGAWVTNGLVTAFFDVNIMYMLAQCAMHPAPSPSSLWVFLAAAYAACWAISVFGVWLAYGVGFQFYRRWRRGRPAIEPIYLSLYANLHLSLLSFDHFCFLLHIRLSAWRTPHVLDIVPETCHFVVQLLPGLVPMAVRAGIASVLLINNWHGVSAAGARDTRFFSPSDGLTPYARDVVLASCAWVGLRIAAVVLAGITLLLFLARPLRATHSREALLGRRDPTSIHFPATTWRDENELQWAWRARTRARIQDAFELCIVRPTRSSITLEKASVPPPAKAHHRGDSIPPRVLSLDFARRDDELEAVLNGTGPSSRLPAVPEAGPGRRRKKESTAPLTFVDSFGSGMMADGFYGDVVELGAYELSPTALFKELQASAGLPRVSEETEPGSGSSPDNPHGRRSGKLSQARGSVPPHSASDIPPASHSLVSLPITSPITPTFACPSPHPLDATTSPEQTFTASKGPVSFELWGAPEHRNVSFSSRLSGFSGDATHGTVDSEPFAFDDGFEELATWSTPDHGKEASWSSGRKEPSWTTPVKDGVWTPVRTKDVSWSPALTSHTKDASGGGTGRPSERPPRGSAFFGDAPRVRSHETLASVSMALDTSRVSTTLDMSMGTDTSGPSIDAARASTTFGLDVYHPVPVSPAPADNHEPPPPAATPIPATTTTTTTTPTTTTTTPTTVPPPPITPPRPARSPKRESTPPRTPQPDPCTPQRYPPPSVSSPHDSCGHDTINESDLFYQPSPHRVRSRHGSTAAVGLRTSAVPIAPDFGALPSIPSPPQSPLLTAALGSPLLAALLPIAAEDVLDLDLEADTMRPRTRTFTRTSPSRRLSFMSDADPWYGNGSPRSSPSKSSTRGCVVPVAPPPVLQLAASSTPSEEASPPVPPPHAAAAASDAAAVVAPVSVPPALAVRVPTPPASGPAAPTPRTEPAELYPSGSLRKRRVPVLTPNILLPPSAFPPPPPEPTGEGIPPPLPSSFSRGYRTRIVRGSLPQWRGDSKTE